MRNILGALAIVGLTAGPAMSDDAGIPSVIDTQMQAFLADDLVRAFSFASPAIREMFGTPENFGVMVRRGYPMVWRPDAVRFLEQREIDGDTWQKVMVTDGQGVAHLLDYQMIRVESDWKINAVQYLGTVGLGA